MVQHPRPRRVAIALMIVVAATLTACDGSGGSAKGATSSTSRRKPARTSTSSSTSPASASTTLPATPDGPWTPTPNATVPNNGTCASQLNVITGAVLGGDLGPVPIADYDLVDCRIAPSNQIWAAVTLAPKPGTSVTPLTVVLERIGAIWVVRAYANDHVSCDAPPPVPAELHLGC